MLQVFSCQATVEHRAQRLGSAVLYCITASDTKSNLAPFLGEKALCVSEGVINFSISNLQLRAVNADELCVNGSWCRDTFINL